MVETSFLAEARKTAVVSPCGRYRYSLHRDWRGLFPAPSMCWIMLNPSTADGREDDPTIRRCLRFAEAHGCGSLTVVNLFAFRATDPDRLKDLSREERTGPDNDAAIVAAVREAAYVVAAWGACKFAAVRAKQVVDDLIQPMGDRPLICLGTLKGGAPRHPLYVPRDQKFAAFGVQS